jgi:mono/diheme cytochrome c family protein
MAVLFLSRYNCSLLAIVVVFTLLLALGGKGHAQQAAQNSGSGKGQSNTGKIARGKYVVEGVAMCGMCHTPRDSSGNLDRSRWLGGAALWLSPAAPTQNWPLKAPRIGGALPASDDDMVRLLTTGIWKDGTRLRPPMPQFRMNKEDAESVVAYLRSLTPAAGD